jgi:hypothetical protein
VNSDVILTPDNIQWSGSVRIAEHQRHLNNALTEFTGIDTDKFSFNIKLTAEVGVDVMVELVKIWTHERKGTPLPLAIGERFYGKFRWQIRNHRVSMRYFDPVGNLSSADVSISLIEYLNR